MHAFCAGVVSCRNELLCISMRERHLVVGLLEWARCGCVPIFDVKAAREAHIPIVIPFVNVRKIRLFRCLLLSTLIGVHLCTTMNGGYLCPPPCWWKYWVLHRRAATCHAHVVGERRSSTPAAATSTVAAPAPAPIERSLLKRLVHWDCKLLNWGDLEPVLLLSSVVCGRRCETHCGHLRHDGRLII